MKSEPADGGPTEGVVFLNIGKQYLPLLAVALRTFREHEPDMPVEVLCDERTPEWFLDALCEERLLVTVYPRLGGRTRRRDMIWRQKPPALMHTRFTFSLYLDSDAIFTRPLSRDLWHVIRGWNMSTATAPGDFIQRAKRIVIARDYRRVYQKRFQAGDIKRLTSACLGYRRDSPEMTQWMHDLGRLVAMRARTRYIGRIPDEYALGPQMQEGRIYQMGSWDICAPPWHPHANHGTGRNYRQLRKTLVHNMPPNPPFMLHFPNRCWFRSPLWHGYRRQAEEADFLGLASKRRRFVRAAPWAMRNRD